MAEAIMKAKEVSGPGETLWLAYSKIFGGGVGGWHALDLQDKLRWSLVEEMTVEHLMAQGDFGAKLKSETEQLSCRDLEELQFFVRAVKALMRHTNPTNVNEGHAQQWFAVSDAISNKVSPLLNRLAALRALDLSTAVEG